MTAARARSALWRRSSRAMVKFGAFRAQHACTRYITVPDIEWYRSVHGEDILMAAIDGCGHGSRLG